MPVLTPLAVLLFLALEGFAAAAVPDATSPPAAGDRQDLVILRGGGMTVRLEVARRATLADTSWIWIALENTGDSALVVESVYYRIESEYDDLESGTMRGSGSLASGNSFDLFPEAYRTSPVSQLVVPARSTHRVAEQPSEYSAALLRLPTEAGMRVRAFFHIHIDLEGGRDLSTPTSGIPFTFEWHVPDEGGFAAMRSRLARLLEIPEQKVHRTYLLGAYLGIPEVARAVSRDDLLGALTRRTEITLDRPTIARHLAARFQNDSVVRDYYLERFRSGDQAAVADLHEGIWDPAFVEPLVSLFESATRFYAALLVLHQHRDDWRSDARTVERLSSAVRRSNPQVEQRVAALKREQLASWASAVRDLSMTGDRSAVGLLKPALRDRRAYQELKHMALAFDMPLPPLRVCDSALAAILTILDGDPENSYRAADLRGLHSGRDTKALNAIRDRLIADLERRLAADGEGQPRR